MWIFKRVRFWLVWGLVAPFVLLFLTGITIFSSRWKLICIKLSLIRLSLYHKFVAEKRIVVV